MLLSNLTWDRILPWSLPTIGWPLFLGCASILVLLTVGTYLLQSRMTKRRLAVLLLFRLTALAVIFLTLLRPAYAVREVDNPPSTLIVVIDDSMSMNNRDDFDRITSSRWDYALRMLKESEPSLDRLRQDKNTTIQFFRFAGDVRDFDRDNPGKAEGKRTDFGQMLEKLYQRFSAAGPLRGIVVISDGADNGPGDPSPHELAEKWRKLPCKLHAIGCGDPTSGERDRDIVLTKITADPPEVPVKNELAITGSIDSYGFKGQQVQVQLLVDDKPVDSMKVVLTADPKKPDSPETHNQVTLKCTAPDKPGDMKVTMIVSELPGELTKENNHLTTYVPVTREGINILFLDRSRLPEPQAIVHALKDDKRMRFRVQPYWLSDTKPTDAPADYFQFAKEHYDVVFIGDVSTAQLKARDPDFFTHLREQVEKNRTGLIWAGGQYSFSDPEWRDRSFADLLPIDPSDVQRVRGATFHLDPTPEGLSRTIMQLADTPEKSQEAWSKLRELEEASRFKLNPGAFILAQHDKGPLFAGYDPGKGIHGRSLVLGVDTTARWQIDDAGIEAHRRFWQQVMLWLAHQDEAEGDIWVDAPQRRLLTGQPFKFDAGLRDRTGSRVKGGTFTAEVVSPTGRNRIDLKDIEMGTSGSVTATDDPGEYRVEIKGSGQGPDGRPIPEKPDAPPTVVRFVVMPNTAETADKAARPGFLMELAKAGGGEYQDIKDFPKFLRKLEEEPLHGERTTARILPDWKSKRTGPLLPLIIVAFTGLLAMEWLCRRKWGMV